MSEQEKKGPARWWESPQAFPGIESPGGGYPGMTLRDWFAAAALTGILDRSSQHAIDNLFGWRAGIAYRYADAMLKAREVK